MPPLVRDTPDNNPRTRPVIAVDGEGWNIPLTAGVISANPHAAERGWHSYVMLAAADDTGWHGTALHNGSRRERTVDTARNYGLPTKTALDFLLSLPRDATVVSFYFSYDATKIMADMPLVNLAELCSEQPVTQEDFERRVSRIAGRHALKPNYVSRARMPNHGLMVDTVSTVWQGYWVSYTPRKRLDIIDLNAGRVMTSNRNPETGVVYKPELRWARRVTVWDAYGFFQKPFTGALADYRCGHCAACKAEPQEHCLTAPWSPADLERIAGMKAQRGVFDPSRQQEIEQYCVDECRYLAFLMRDLMIHVDEFGLKPSSWHGSGAIANAWMKQNNIKDYLAIRTETSPSEFSLSGLPEEIALCAYFGGRFEISEMGPMGELYGYDINSAYPYITCGLPCLAHGRFRRVNEYEPGKIGVYLAGSRTSGRFAPFPFRTADSGQPDGMAKDAIYYCHGGQRWVWQDELAVARKHFGTGAIPVYDGWVWDAECDHKPFAAIPELYVQRQQFVRERNGVEKIIKLVLNSLYGKTAQSLGWSVRNGEYLPPTYQSFIWAGLITSGCRAMILDAVMQPGADVTSIATDGILARTPVTGIAVDHTAPDGCEVQPGSKCEHGLKAEKVLGQWDYGKHTDAYLFQSGVYTMLNPCKPDCSSPEHKHEYTSDGRLATRKYATRGFAAKEIPAQVLINAWEAGQLTVSASPEESRFVPMKSGVLRTEALEYIGQWLPSEHDVSFTHNRRREVIADYLDFDLSRPNPLSMPWEIPSHAVSAPYKPHQTWESVLENQPLPDEIDYMEIVDGWAEQIPASRVPEPLSAEPDWIDTGLAEPDWADTGPAEPDWIDG